MMKVCFTILFFACCSFSSFSQCEVKFDAIVDAASSASKGSIQFKITNSLSGPVTVSLHDLMEQSLPLVQEKRVDASALQNGIIFSGLKPTTYIIQVKFKGCSKTIGGPHGFKVDLK